MATNRTASAREANEKAATDLERVFVAAFRQAPEKPKSNNAAARYLSEVTGISKASIASYLGIYLKRGDASLFHRLYAVRDGVVKQRHERKTGWPAVWRNRDAPPKKPEPPKKAKKKKSKGNKEVKEPMPPAEPIGCSCYIPDNLWCPKHGENTLARDRMREQQRAVEDYDPYGM